VISFVSDADAQDEEVPAPYLYYYSGILNAFVMERADGTNSRMLAQDVMPKTHNAIHRPDWSPSGEWLAWRSGEFGGLGPTYYSGWVIRSDNSQRLSILDHPSDAFVNVDVMEWAPDDDLLFVAETNADANRENAVRRYLLIDAAEEEIVADYQFNPPYIQGDFSTQFIWLPDEQGVIVYENSFQDGLFLLRIVSLLTSGDVVTKEYSVQVALGLSPDGYFAYISRDETELVVENLIDNSSITYSLPIRSDPFDRLTWNPEYDLAAYYIKHEENYDLRLLDFTTGEDSNIMANVQLMSVRSSHSPDLMTGITGVWSPDGIQYLFKTADDSHWLFSLTDGSLTLLENFPQYEAVIWNENGHQLILDNDDGVHVYDLISLQSTFVPQVLNLNVAQEHLSGRSFFPSFDGTYIGLISSTIINLTNGQSMDISVHSAAVYASPYVWHYEWHNDRNWTITVANVTFAGCCGANAYTVVRPGPDANIYRRELTVRWGDSAGWIPDRALTHLVQGQPQSVLQQPSTAYRFPDIIDGLVWNPEGNDVAVVTQSGDVFIQTINARTAQQPVFVTNAHCSPSGYGLPCPIYWENGIIRAGDRVWNIEQERFIDLDNMGHIICDDYGCTESPQDVISDDGRWIARHHGTNTIHVIDQSTNEIIEHFQGETHETTVAFQWVNTRLIMITAYTVTIFDANTGEVTTLESVRDRGFEDRFYVARVSSDGRHVAAASITTPVHIWDIATGELVTVLNWYAHDIAFSPDGHWLAAGNTDLVTIWDMPAQFLDE